MKTALIIIAAIIILVAACLVVWKTAKTHELHKIRAAFENYDHVLREHFGDQPAPRVEGFEEGQKILEGIEEKEKHEFI